MDIPTKYHRGQDAQADKVSDQVTAVAAQLLDAVDPARNADQALRRLLERALKAAAEAQGQISEQKGEIERLRALSVTDEATGLLNRRGFSEALSRSMERGRRYGENGALVISALDGYKAITVKLGHAAGEAVPASRA